MADAFTPIALTEAEIADLVEGRHGDPFAILGPHRAGTVTILRTFQPGASRVAVLDGAGREVAVLDRIRAEGLFAGAIDDLPGVYRYAVEWDRTVVILEDPYRFPPVLSEYDLYLLAEGTHERAHDKLGAHPMALLGIEGTAFAVWAPNASRISVVGDFNHWDGRRHPMRRRVEAGIWELFIPGLAPGALYKYEMLDARGAPLPAKADPFAFAAERPPATASIVVRLPDPPKTRLDGQDRADPISIYEVHLGSWKRGPDNRYLTYAELADELVPYARHMGFTHIELMPVTEHPFDGSWGYQPTGLFAPTSRFGDPEGFRAFIDRAHEAGLKILLDWVPGHFPNDAHGLALFDGSHLYEHEDPRQGRHMDWDTLIYNFGRAEVRGFLLSSASFWIERYGLDGLRVDAVASMLYRNYSRREGEWVPNRHGGVENEEAIELLKRMNERVYARFPKSITVAEESTAWPLVSRPTSIGGLGFGYKWNMGWMHDTLAYMREDPVHRRWHHDKLTFGLVYAFSENFILPLSHDEVVHGKGSLLAKMPGDEWQKFANLRAYLAFQFTHPGKKLLFMGAELAQAREWNHDRGLDWHLLGDSRHLGIQALVRDLNHLYRGLPALHARDCAPDGFEWIDAENRDDSVLAFLRRGADPKDVAVIVCNFTPLVRPGYRIGVPLPGLWTERMNTDSAFYGGSNVGNGGGRPSEEVPHHGRAHSITATLPPLATLVFTPRQESV